MTSFFGGDTSDNPGNNPNTDAGELGIDEDDDGGQEQARADYEEFVGSDEHEAEGRANEEDDED